MQDKITIADAPDCLNTNDKAMWVLGYQAAIEARSTCLLQIQEPPTKTEALAHYSKQAILAMDEAAPAAVAVPDAVRDALLQSEAALEVATARILKADPDHSISVTSEAKALVAVRAALAATPAAEGSVSNVTFAAAPVVLPEPDMNEEGYIPCPFCGSNHVSLSTGEKADGEPWYYVECESCTATAESEKWNERALLAGVSAPEIPKELIAAIQRSGLQLIKTTAGFELLKLGQAYATGVSAPAGQAVEQAPVLYVSKGQLAKHRDPDGPNSTEHGRYLPARVTPAGKFTTPLFSAPQAQADARDAEQERWMGIGKAIERACVDLPVGAEIILSLEKDAGTVTLTDEEGDEQENFPTDGGLAGVVNAAIEAAIAAAKGE